MFINSFKFSKGFKIAFLTLMSAIVSGCFHTKGVHYVNHYGDSDNGGYIMSMNSGIYLAYIAEHPDGFSGLSKFSRPSITHNEGITYISDKSGNASMENFYDNYKCVPTQNKRGWSDCTFIMNKDKLDFLGWSFDWNVVLHREMVLLNSNHHRKRVSNGVPTLMWYFDGNRVSEVDVKFTVRVPNS